MPNPEVNEVQAVLLSLEDSTSDDCAKPTVLEGLWEAEPSKYLVILSPWEAWSGGLKIAWADAVV